jgi:hypothetical protein
VLLLLLAVLWDATASVLELVMRSNLTLLPDPEPELDVDWLPWVCVPDVSASAGILPDADRLKGGLVGRCAAGNCRLQVQVQ